MQIIPWRVKSAISNRLPLVYHIAASLIGTRRNKDYWDKRLAETWHQRTWPTKNKIIAERTSTNDEILDIACGNGSVLRDLKERGYTSLSGLEISDYAIERLRQEGFTMFSGYLPRLPLPNSSFDTIIASQVLEHIIRRGVFASEVARILKPGGQAFFFVPNDCLGPIDEPEHVIKYNALTLDSFLRRHFEVTSIEVIKDDNYTMSILLGQVRKCDQKRQ